MGLDDTGLIGQVTRTFPWTAEVALISDREQVVPVQVVRNGLRAAVFGIGYDGALDLRFMPVNTDVENGDTLVTSGIDGVYPPGLPVAVVSNIERNAAYPFAKITCTPAAGPNRNRPESTTRASAVMISSRNGSLPRPTSSSGTCGDFAAATGVLRFIVAVIELASGSTSGKRRKSTKGSGLGQERAGRFGRVGGCRNGLRRLSVGFGIRVVDLGCGV